MVSNESTATPRKNLVFWTVTEAQANKKIWCQDVSMFKMWWKHRIQHEQQMTNYSIILMIRFQIMRILWWCPLYGCFGWTTLYKICRDSVLYEYFPHSLWMIRICDWPLLESGAMQLVCGRRTRSLMVSESECGKTLQNFPRLSSREYTSQGRGKKSGTRPMFPR